MKTVKEKLTEHVEEVAQQHNLEPVVWLDSDAFLQFFLFDSLKSPCSILLKFDPNADAIGVAIFFPNSSDDSDTVEEEFSVFFLSQVIEFINRQIPNAIAKAVLAE